MILNEMTQLAKMSVSELAVADVRPHALRVVDRFLKALELGEIRSATCENGTWTANKAVKEGILVCFRVGQLAQMSDALWSFVDKDTLPIQHFDVSQRVRIVPGGSSVRRGAYLAPGVTMMPPAYVNVGAFVDSDTMIDSHALVGSCAQIGKRVHLSAAAQIGGVLEPVGATPVIVEDDAFIGGNCGLYEGTIVRKRAVIAAGVVLTRSSGIYDLVNERIVRSENDAPLEVPEGAVVVPGSRPARGAFAEKNGISLSCAVIVKYRDEKTDAKAMLEIALRN
jgi:2,3,4,5-tetrahydropyridine-2-carboxylate N-succinyltransferase